MTGNIHNAGVNFVATCRGQIQFREAEIDADLSPLFLRQTIRIRSCERFYQRAFAVIDVTCRGDDEMFRCHITLSNHEEHEAHEELQDKTFDSVLELYDVEVYEQAKRDVR